MTESIDELTNKQLRRLEKASDSRTLEPWERYRALSDLHDAYFDMVELADRKARFALLTMGALNALNLIVGTQRVLGDVATVARPLVGLYFTIYAALALFFFVQAIETLRPRISMFPAARPTPESRAGLRFIQDILGASDEDYAERWSGVQIGQLCRETAQHVQVLARISDVKFRALDRVYNGLMAMTGLSALMVLVLAYYRLMN